MQKAIEAGLTHQVIRSRDVVRLGGELAVIRK